MEEAGLQVQWAWPQRFSRRGPRRSKRDLVEEAGPEVQWARVGRLKGRPLRRKAVPARWRWEKFGEYLTPAAAGGGAGAVEWGGAVGVGAPQRVWGGGARPDQGQVLKGLARKRGSAGVVERGGAGRSRSGPRARGRGLLRAPAGHLVLSQLHWPEALGSPCSGSSGGVCAMGDPERPEAARPQPEEVNSAVASSPAPLSRLASGLRAAAGTCKVQDLCSRFYSLPPETRGRPGLALSPQPRFVFSSTQKAVPAEG